MKKKLQELVPSTVALDPIKTGENLYWLRKKRRLSMDAFAVNVGVHYHTVSNWQSGVYMPSADALLKISDVLQLPIEELLIKQGEEIPEKHKPIIRKKK